MNLFKRRLLLGSALVILVLLGGWFYYIYFVSTGRALRTAEAFQFRRMQVAQLADQEAYRFFFVTNRRAETDEGPLKERLGTERKDTLTFGLFDTEIEPTLGIGMLINPSDWFINEEIGIRDIQALDQVGFVEKVRKPVQQSPHRSLLVVVHGFREAFTSALRKTAFLGHVLDINSPVLLFDWPGNQGSSLRGYRRAQRVAEASGAELAKTLKLIIEDIQPERLWVIANSMGAKVVTHAFSHLYQDPELADAETEIKDVVLTAPDVDRDDFNRQFKTEIDALAKNLTVYVSANDQALLVSRLINRGRRLGESTLDTLNPDQLEEAAAVMEFIDPDTEQVTLVDVTPVNRTRNFHNFSLETPEFFDDLFLRLTNSRTPRNRLRYQLHTPDGKVYHVLTRGR